MTVLLSTIIEAKEAVTTAVTTAINLATQKFFNNPDS